MQATHIIAIRHGETAWNVDTRIQGHLDIPLNDTGLWQAEQLARALAGEPIAAIYTSHLQRAPAPAQAPAHHGPPSPGGAGAASAVSRAAPSRRSRPSYPPTRCAGASATRTMRPRAATHSSRCTPASNTPSPPAPPPPPPCPPARTYKRPAPGNCPTPPSTACYGPPTAYT